MCHLSFFFALFGFILFTLWLLLAIRAVIELVKLFSYSWHPVGPILVILEIIMSVTDFPIKILERFIPKLKLGRIQFDFSVIILLLLVFICMQLAFSSSI